MALSTRACHDVGMPALGQKRSPAEVDAGTRQLSLDVDPGSTIQLQVEQQAQGAIVIVDRGEFG
jgi:hypothetical protein